MNFKLLKRKLLVGLAVKDITPDFSTSLHGYRPRDSNGVHDRLNASCVVFATADCKVAIISISVLLIDAECTASIREGAAKATGITEKNILVHATHTHSAPLITGTYKDILIKSCIECIIAADADCSPGHVGFGSTTVTECGKNRRYLDYGGMPVDPEIGIVVVTDEHKRVKAVIYNYACHCTVLGADNRLITKDWPHFADRAIKTAVGENVVTVFIQGASGDINPGYSAGLSAVSANIPTRTWAEAERIGGNVGRAVVSALKSINMEGKAVLRSHTSRVNFPTRTSYPVSLQKARGAYAAAERKVKAMRKSSQKISIKRIERTEMELFFASLILKGAKNFYGRKWPGTVKAELQTIRINDNAITSFPVEAFHEIGVAVKKGSPAKITLVAELSNTLEAEGYMPTPESYQEGDYEVFDTYYDGNAAPMMVKASLENISQVFHVDRCKRGS